MNKIGIIIVSLFTFFSLDAQTVLHVDMSRILQEFPETKEADAKLQERGKMYQMQEDTLIQQLKSVQADLQKSISKGNITQLQVNDQEARIRQIDQQIKKERNENLQNLEKYRQELVAPTMTKIYKWVAEIAEKRNASIVYDLFSGRIVYINDKLSINDEVIGKIPSVKK